ncbi:DNA adenine methylase [Mycobacteroides abscessus]|uniref:DNA adenine methylase n=1 Tax=Mycobacteroides abscessus TaxID=36809 RepID=UPI0005E36AA1|nr:Dam family site-specific DNA-(adenine-N6)-methyltransferase [Mycobacteroides abscessus]CPT89994.1 Modification methylase DpnIIA [Mycobacteroides abscessus]
MGVNRSQPIPPFLRWVGGKRWLLPTVRDLVSGLDFRGYHEPFVGAGSIFFGLVPTGRVFLSDLNRELIDTYVSVASNYAEVSRKLERHPNTADHYYAIRSQSLRGHLERAAAFIYLNHTSFNGIYRVNLDGQYNVPYGDRKHIRIPDRGHLRQGSQALQGVRLSHSDFELCLRNVRRGDLVFLDPPYTVAHNNNGFIKYNQKLFAFDDQVRLLRTIKEIDNVGAYFILTNAAHESISDLFGVTGRCLELTRRSAVSGKATSRGRARELLFTNIPEKGDES